MPTIKRKKIDKEKAIEIIERWYFGLGYTQGIVVNLQKACSNYDIMKLKDEIKNEQ